MPKLWEREAQRKKYEDHVRRMDTMKPAVDDRPPKRMHIDSKKKLDERVCTVDDSIHVPVSLYISVFV
jgi:hypothetical protein